MVKLAFLSWNFGDHSSLNRPSQTYFSLPHFLSHVCVWSQCVFILICTYMLIFHRPKSNEFKSTIILSLNIPPQLPKLLGTQPKATPLWPRAFKTQRKQVCLVCFTASLNGENCIGFKLPETVQSSKMTEWERMGMKVNRKETKATEQTQSDTWKIALTLGFGTEGTKTLQSDNPLCNGQTQHSSW